MRKAMLLAIATVLIASIVIGIVLAEQQYYPSNAGIGNVFDAMGYGFSNAFQRFNNFFAGGYYSYQKLVDFAVLFLLFSTASLIGLKQWMGEQNRQVTALAFIVGFMMALTLVLSTDFTLAGLFPFAKGFLFIIGVILVYSLLLKLDMEKHKFLAFILAVALVFFFFYLSGWWTGGPDFRTKGFPSQVSSLFKTTKYKPPEEKVDLVECEYEQTAAFGFEQIIPATGADKKNGWSSLEEFADVCVEKAVVTAYASPNERNAKVLNQQRADKVKELLTSHKGTVKTIPKGHTLKFQRPVQEVREKIEVGDPAYDDEVKDNRAYTVTCMCRKKGVLEKGKEKYEEWIATESCREAMESSAEGLIKDVIRGAGERATVRLIDTKKRSYYADMLEKCENEYKQGKISKATYYDAVVRFHTELGKAYFEVGEYANAKKSFEEIPRKTDRIGEAMDAYYGLLYNRFQADRDLIKKNIDGQSAEGIKARIRALAALRDQVVRSIDERARLAFYEYKPTDYGDISEKGN